MRLIALEEHIATAEVVDAWRRLEPQWRDVGFNNSTQGPAGAALQELGEQRLAAMDASGVDVQVLSLTTPGVQNLLPGDAARLQTQVNDLLAQTVRARPDRFQAVATLATPDPKAATQELERAVTRLGLKGAMLFGRTRGQNMDHPDYWPIYEAAAAMRAPLYIHPQSSPSGVRNHFYGGFDFDVSMLFSIGGLGWHYETGVQVIRLILSGVLDRYLRWASEVVGPDRLLFSTDYPFENTSGGKARRFLEEANLSEIDRVKFASGNWERLVSGVRAGRGDSV